MSLQRGIDLKALAEKMGQCSGAEVRGICTEAGVSVDGFCICVN
jgi:26S proteasome regulatory subunit T6